ncbi:MAG: glycosyltransferase family 4 protein [Thermoleophilia bacterium]
MKIGFITERMLCGFGVDLVIDQVAGGLAARGHEVTVFASVSDESFQPGRYELKLIPTPAYAFFPRYDLSAQRHLKYLNGEDIDIWLVQTFPYFSYLPRLKAPAVAVVYGVSSTAGFPARIRTNFAYVNFMQNQIYFRFARRLTAISSFLRDGLPRGIARKTEVIHLGADHYVNAAGRDTPAEAVALRRELGVDDDDLLLLYVGRLSAADQPYKGTAKLVELYSRLHRQNKRLRLLMVGFGGPREREWLTANGVLVLENAPAEQMPAIFSACDLYLTGSRWEGFDLPLVEAQSFGKPVAALDIGAHPEVVAAGRSGFLASGMDELGDAVLRLAGDEQLRADMSQAALEHAGGFLWENTVTAYERLLKEVL